MIVQDLSAADTLRFQNPGVYVQGIAADGTPQSLSAAMAAGLAAAPVATAPAIGAAAGAVRVSSTALEASHILKASAGTLISIIGYSAKASAQFIQIHDSATLPADAAVPVVTFTVPATGNFSLDVPITGMPFTTGIVVCNSSTSSTKTIGSADIFVTAVLK